MDDPRLSDPAALALAGVGLVLGGTRILDRLTLDLGPCEQVAIVGDAGAGKSLVARIALGLVRPDEGEVRLFGEPVGASGGAVRRLLRARCGVALQGGSLFGELSVGDNLRLGFAPARGDPARHRRRLDRMLIDFGLQHRAHDPVAALSAGDQRRLELARALLRDPALLVLDEPFQGAIGHAAELETLLAGRLRGRPRALLLTTQDIALARRMATRVLMLRRGRLEAV